MTSLQGQLDQHRQKVDVDHLDIPIRELLRMIEDGEFRIAPEYQRQFRWDERRESELVESILLGLPVPPLFVATNADATWELVDGLQRVSTLVHYVGGAELRDEHLEGRAPLHLSGLKKLTKFNDLVFEDLPAPLQVTFLRRALRVTALSDKSQLDVRFDLFERLNRGGVVLTPQEVRACIYRGAFNQYILEAASSEPFKSLLKLQKGNSSDGTREEQVLKFFAYLEDRSNFDGKVTDFLNQFMEKNREPGDHLVAWRGIFDKSVAALWKIFDGPVLKGNYALTPVNQFEAILVAVAELIREGKEPAGDPQEIMNDADLLRFSTKGTNTASALRGRISRAKELLEK